jgi:hypothetical protein
MGRMAHGGVGSVPAAVGPGSVDVPLAMRRHAPGRGQPGDVVAVDLAPDAFRLAWREPLQNERSSNAFRMPSIHPQQSATSSACAWRHRRRSRAFLVNLQPQFCVAIVIDRQPSSRMPPPSESA